MTLFELVGQDASSVIADRIESLDRVHAMADTADLVALTASDRVPDQRQSSITATDAYSVHMLPAMIERIRNEAPQVTILIVVE